MNTLWQQWSLRPQWQQNLGLLLLALTTITFMALGLWRPLWLAHAQAKQEMPLLQADYERLWRQAQKMPLLLERLPLAETALRQQQQRLPTDAPTELSLLLHQLVSAQSLNLNQIRPLPNESFDGLMAHPYAFSSSGDADAMLALIKQLRDHPNLLILTDFTLSQQPGQASSVLHLEARLHTLTLSRNDDSAEHEYDPSH